MFIFFILLAVVAAAGMWATEQVDRPARRQAQLDRHATITSGILQEHRHGLG